MRISKLDLYGFKSFPDRTAFQFGSGVSCVVGPNGCGKSNVVDALRWCIGEQSARKLRGGEMLDVIFAGSSERAPVGFAEVMLTLTADSGEPFPGEYAHMESVQVGRRLHRNGTSEYVINQVKCRRRDIVELFLDTGIGNNLYSFIEQGQVDKMVHASPLERRGIIDEAAGIARYAARRSEAQARLEATGAQLDRAADVADEMGRRLRVLERQVLKAARFRRLRALIRQDEILLSLVKYTELSADRRALRQSTRDHEGEGAALRRELDRRQSDLVSRREELAVVEAAANQWRDEVAEHDARGRELEGAKAFQEKRVVELSEQRDRVTAEVAAAAASEVEESGIAAEAQARGVEITEALVGARSELQDAKRSAVASSEAKEQARQALRAHEDASEVASTELAAWRLAAERDALRMAELPGLRASLEERLGAARTALGDQRARREAARVVGGELEARLEVLTGACEAAREVVAQADRDLRETQERARTEESALERLRADVEDEVASRVAEARVSLDRVEAVRRAGREAALAALERARREGTDEVEAHFAGALHQAQEAEAARADAAAAALAQAIAQATREVREVAAVRIDALQREAADRGAEAARLEASVTDWVAEGQERAAEIARLEGLLSAHAARLEADGERSEAVGILAEVLADGRPLSERSGLSEAELEALTPILGGRLLMPVVEEAELERLSEALGDRQASVLWVPSGDPLSALRERIAVFETLAEALAHHASTGGAASVSTTGEHIGVDGVVQVGRPSRAVASQLHREREVATAEHRLVEARREQDALALRIRDGRVRLAALVQAQEAHAQQARDVELQARADEGTRLGSLRAEAASSEQAAVAIHRRARQELADTRASALDSLRSGWEAPVDASAPVARRVLEAYADQRQAFAREDAEHALAVEAAEARVRSEGEGARQAVQRRIASGREALESTREEAFVAGERQRVAVEACAQVERDRSAVDLELARNAVEVEASEAAIQGSTTRVEALVSQHAELEAEARVLEHGHPERRERMAAAEAGEEARRATLEQLRAADDEAVSSALRSAERVAQCEVAIAGLVERQTAQATLGTDAAARARAAAERVLRGTEHVSALEARVAEARQLSASAAAEIDVLSATRGEAWDRLQRERDRMSGLRDGLRAAEEALRELSIRRESMAAKIVELQQRAQQVKVEVEVLRRRMDERYQVSLAGLVDRVAASAVTLKPDPAVRAGFEVGGKTVEAVEPLVLSRQRLGDERVIREAVADLETHRGALAALGEVNLGALEEYEDLGRRHGELVDQRSDLEASVSSIRSAIAKMNRTCRQRFRDAFDKVNENFQVAYPRLVGGGAARLSLTDEDDLLETGVEIFVQPPGKRLQNLTLLSGGEKAMTAIALLIALFRVKPSPFCVLDEVDAPLDEANGARFNEMLREMAALSQFVVITHNRKTMEVADALYGVTMTKPGVSRLVSVKLSSTG